eukprot:jgi/Botrbrau1/14043/Bobra.0011s0009.1
MEGVQGRSPALPDIYKENNRITAAFLKKHLNQPTYPGGNETIREAVYSMLEMKMKHKLTDAALDDTCRMNRLRKVPQPNLHPSSLHMCLKVAECRDYRSTMRHVCSNGCVMFPTLRPSEYGRHTEDACPECGSKRLREVKSGMKTTLRPARVVYVLGVGHAIRQLFNDAEFCKLRGSGRDVEGDYYESVEAARLYRAAQADIGDVCTSVYELGFDFFQIYTNRQHSIGLLTLRCLDIPSLHRSKLKFTKVIAVISGPKEPHLIKGGRY